MGIKNILVATDFSPGASRAAKRAARLAQQHQADLHLVHVIPAMSWKAFGLALVEHPLVTEKQLYEAALTQLEQAAQELRQQFGLPVQAYVDIGRAHTCIADYARSHAIDLTVMGAHAENMARDVFVGATTLKYLHAGTDPILVTRNMGGADYRRILVPVDFSEISRPTLETAIEFAQDATICVLHVYEVFFEGKLQYAAVGDDVIEHYRIAAHDVATQKMTEFLDGFATAGQCLPILRHGPAARTILEEAGTMAADLIVMGKRGGSELDQLLLGSVTENVLYGLDRDILLVGER